MGTEINYCINDNEKPSLSHRVLVMKDQGHGIIIVVVGGLSRSCEIICAGVCFHLNSALFRQPYDVETAASNI